MPRLSGNVRHHCPLDGEDQGNCRMLPGNRWSTAHQEICVKRRLVFMQTEEYPKYLARSLYTTQLLFLTYDRYFGRSKKGHPKGGKSSGASKNENRKSKVTKSNPPTRTT